MVAIPISFRPSASRRQRTSPEILCSKPRFEDQDLLYGRECQVEERTSDIVFILR